jgi:predicted nucleotidyltransferase
MNHAAVARTWGILVPGSAPLERDRRALAETDAERREAALRVALLCPVGTVTDSSRPPRYKRRRRLVEDMVTSRSAVVERVADVLAGHPVTFAMLFGSVAREEDAEWDDVDVAVEFEGDVGDDGYSDAYLGLVTDLEGSLDVDVDVVPFASMSPRFFSVVLEDGVLIVGTEARRDELERRLDRDAPSAEEARERVAAVASRLTASDA